jgi:hypothetical protein
MMIYLGLLLSSISGLFGLILLRRLHRARAAVRTATSVTGQPSRLLDLLRRKLNDLIDRDLLADTGPRGFAEVAIRFRELHDAPDVDKLLGAIAKTAESREKEELVDLIKYLFILQHSLGEPIAEFEGCVREVVTRFEDMGFQVTIPQEGELFDSNTMWALKLGSRVKQPMGVTLKDESGRVVNKSKVLCQ